MYGSVLPADVHSEFNTEATVKKKRFQWIWWGFHEMTYGFKRLNSEESDLYLIYNWVLCLGPLEIRRWNNRESLGRMTRKGKL